MALPAIFAITLHEAAHGFVAYRCGDDTACRMGRVTFNPLRAHRSRRHDPAAAAAVRSSRAAASCSAMPSRCRCASRGCAVRAATWCWWRLAGPAINSCWRSSRRFAASASCRYRAGAFVQRLARATICTSRSSFNVDPRGLQHDPAAAARRRPGRGRAAARGARRAAGADRALRHPDPVSARRSGADDRRSSRASISICWPT